jgi:AraC-like DNA-binding protein
MRSPQLIGCSKGIFAASSSSGLVLRSYNRKAQARLRDHVAELLSQDLDFHAIALRLGISRKAVSRHFEKIKADLGPQAV